MNICNQKKAKMGKREDLGKERELRGQAWVTELLALALSTNGRR